MTTVEHITAAEPTRRIDALLVDKLGLTRSASSRLIKEGAVLVEGRPVRPSFMPSPGDKIIVTLKEERQLPAPQPPELTILYQDDKILVIDKPAGIAVHTAPGERGRATIADALTSHVADPETPERPGIVHRLDKDTSGVLIVARDPDTKADLARQFKDRESQKTYLAVVIGRLRPAEATIRLPLARKPQDPMRRAVHPGGKDAETAYRTLAEAPGYSLVEAHPKTGRTHQIRVHFAALGHPVAGDRLYGGRQLPGAPARQLLHAASLTIRHPDKGEMTFNSPMPDDMRRFWEARVEAV